jgi:1-acyl-sn-glycerol-3-phosphate acyltransferase
MRSWHYDPAADLEQDPIERLRRFPREPDMLVYGLRSLAALCIRAWLRLYHRLRIEGKERLPREGSLVLVANHASHLDALCLLAALPLRKLHRAFPAAAHDYFFIDTLRLAFSAVVANVLPFDRKLQVRDSLRLCRELLANPGNILILFPEGTRSQTGEVGRFKPGIGMLLAGSSVPAVPCRIEGAFAAWPRARRLPRPRPIRLVIGEPTSYAALPAGKVSAEWICEDLRKRVLALGAGRPAATLEDDCRQDPSGADREGEA